MNAIDSIWRIVRRPEILSVFVVVFTADVVAGITIPTFSLYAVSLGASLALVGILTGAGGLTSIFASVPVGALSDARGRKVILSTGILIFSLTAFLYTIAPTPILLLPARILASLGLVSVFMVGIAYVGDRVSRQERGLAVGLYTTAMGLGFTVGPALGGFVSAKYGYRASYRIAAVIALAGWLVAVRWLSPDTGPREDAAQADAVPLWKKLRLMATEPGLLGASIANLGNNVLFTTLFSFFPLYVAGLSIGDAALGAMFAGRALASTFARLPTGLLSMHVRNRYLMTVALAISSLVLLAISRVSAPSWLAILLMVDGIAYGMFLTAGQAHVTNLSAESERGTAVGLYSMAGSIGATIGPVTLGLIAGWLGLASTFRIAAGFVMIVTVAFWVLGVYADSLRVVDTEYSSS